MDPKIERIYNAALKHPRFLETLQTSDTPRKPEDYANNDDKSLIAAIFYGWLVGKYGLAWDVFI